MRGKTERPIKSNARPLRRLSEIAFFCEMRRFFGFCRLAAMRLRAPFCLRQCGLCAPAFAALRQCACGRPFACGNAGFVLRLLPPCGNAPAGALLPAAMRALCSGFCRLAAMRLRAPFCLRQCGLCAPAFAALRQCACGRPFACGNAGFVLRLLPPCGNAPARPALRQAKTAFFCEMRRFFGFCRLAAMRLRAPFCLRQCGLCAPAFAALRQCACGRPFACGNAGFVLRLLPPCGNAPARPALRQERAAFFCETRRDRKPADYLCSVCKIARNARSRAAVGSIICILRRIPYHVRRRKFAAAFHFGVSP